MARRLGDSFRYAVEGLLYSLRTQANMRIHLAAALVVVSAAILLGLSRAEVVALILAVIMVIGAEMMNTAVEAAVDLTTGSYHPLARIAKNVAAGAVLVSAIGAVLVGYLVFIDELTSLSRAPEPRASRPMALLVPLSVGLVLLLVLGAKALPHRFPWVLERTSTPSGYTALAFCISTWIAVRTGDALVTVLAYTSSILVGHSRVDSGARTMGEVAIGACVGVGATILVRLLGR